MRLIFHDIETIKGFFLYCAIHDGKRFEFRINKDSNDLFAFIQYLKENEDAYFVGYNSINFDSQVIEYIFRNYTKWIDMTGLEIAAIIHEYASNVIKDSNNGGFPPFREEHLTFKQLDVFKVQHFDNKNRRVGLKRLEYEMDMPNIQELSFPSDKVEFNDIEIGDIVQYCYNDVEATELNYKHLIGEVDHELYKGQNIIDTRIALSEHFGFNALNYSDSKYGDEIIKHLYCKEANCEYNQLPKKGTFRKSVAFKEGIPDYIEFKTPELQKFLKDVKHKVIKGSEKFELELPFRGQLYTFALGGLHNIIKNKVYHSDEDYVIKDIDVRGYYPNIIINNGYAPKHLNKSAFLRASKWIVSERDRLKPDAKKDKRIKGIVAGYKQAANSVYGKLGDMLNWLYDPQAILNVCISGQMSILMLIEALELAGNQCIMANTDGATFYMKRTEEENFNRICKEWMDKTNYFLEFSDYESLYFLTVNDYLGITTSNEVKAKGDFLTATELHKNKSFRVIPLALKEYLVNGVAPEKFINGFDNIYHFCGRSTAGNTYYHVEYGDTVNDLPKLIRYFVAKKGSKILKHVKEGNDTGARDTNVTPADKKKFICNQISFENTPTLLLNVDRQWYIDEVRGLIRRLELGKTGKVDENPNQLKLF